MSQVYIPERKGSLQVEMMAAARRRGLVSYELAPRFDDLLREIAAGTPVIVLQRLGFIGGWHYAVAIGYDYDRGQLILRSGETERELLPFAVHEMVWKRSGYWAMVAVPPERIPATAEESRWLAAIAALERTGAASAASPAYASFLKRWPENIAAAIGLANTHHALGELHLRRGGRPDPSHAPQQRRAQHGMVDRADRRGRRDHRGHEYVAALTFPSLEPLHSRYENH